MCALVLAAHRARGLPTKATNSSSPQKNEGRRSAGRRDCLVGPRHQRMTPSLCASGEARVLPAALALRRSTAAFAGVAPRLSFGPRFLESPGANGRTLPGASAASSSRTGTCRTSGAPKPPGADCVSPRAGAAPAAATRSTLMMASLRSGRRALGQMRTAQSSVTTNEAAIVRKSLERNPFARSHKIAR